MKTIFFNNTKRMQKWILIDAKNIILGRLVSKVAKVIQGKDNPFFTPNMDLGSNIVIINAKYISLSRNKKYNKYYWTHSGYPGGLKKTSFMDLLEKRPEKILLHSIKGMLPKTKLGRKILKKVRVYPTMMHRHHAQKPVTKKV